MIGGMGRVVFLLPTATYRANDFVDAARRLGIEVVVASERRQAMADAMGPRALVVPFDDPDVAAQRVIDLGREHAVDAVVAVDEAGVVPAAVASEALGLPHNPPDAVRATRDKIELRRRLDRAGVRQPRFAVAEEGDDVAAIASEVGLPCVVKAVSLSASRGVIRADTPEEAAAAARRVREVLASADTGSEAPPDPHGPLLVESYLPGAEVAVEGLLDAGALRVLALFDKPDPMVGPVFAETLLVTPSRLPAAIRERIAAVVADATAALGLVTGPVHAEVRVDGEDVAFLELAARSIGGLCARTLRFGTGTSLEEVIIRHAAGLPIESLEREGTAAGVVMLPVERAGVFRELRGREAALAVEGIEGLEVTVSPGTEVRPLPESSRYVGFLFARGDDPETVEAALREAWARLDMVIEATPSEEG